MNLKRSNKNKYRKNYNVMQEMCFTMKFTTLLDGVKYLIRKIYIYIYCNHKPLCNHPQNFMEVGKPVVMYGVDK